MGAGENLEVEIRSPFFPNPQLLRDFKFECFRFLFRFLVAKQSTNPPHVCTSILYLVCWEPTEYSNKIIVCITQEWSKWTSDSQTWLYKPLRVSTSSSSHLFHIYLSSKNQSQTSIRKKSFFSTKIYPQPQHEAFHCNSCLDGYRLLCSASASASGSGSARRMRTYRRWVHNHLGLSERVPLNLSDNWFNSSSPFFQGLVMHLPPLVVTMDSVNCLSWLRRASAWNLPVRYKEPSYITVNPVALQRNTNKYILFVEGSGWTDARINRVQGVVGLGGYMFVRTVWGVNLMGGRIAEYIWVRFLENGVNMQCCQSILSLHIAIPQVLVEILLGVFRYVMWDLWWTTLSWLFLYERSKIGGDSAVGTTATTVYISRGLGGYIP